MVVVDCVGTDVGPCGGTVRMWWFDSVHGYFRDVIVVGQDPCARGLWG